MWYGQMNGPDGQFDRAQQAARRGLQARGDLLSLALLMNLALLYLCQTVVAWAVVWWIRRMGLSTGAVEVINELYTMVVYGAAFLPPYLLYARVCRLPFRSLPSARPYPPVLAAGAGVTLGMSASSFLLGLGLNLFFALFGLYPMDIPLTLPGNPLAAVLFVVNIALLPAVVEELIFRGIVLQSLRPWGDGFAVAVSAVLFALLHRNTAQFPNALLMGVALGYFVVKTNSLWTSMLIHLANNAFILILAVASQEMGYLGQLAIQGLQMALYGLAGILGVWYLWHRRLDLRLPASRCPLPQRECLSVYATRPLTLVLLAVFCGVFFLNFSR